MIDLPVVDYSPENKNVGAEMLAWAKAVRALPPAERAAIIRARVEAHEAKRREWGEPETDLRDEPITVHGVEFDTDTRTWSEFEVELQ